MKGTTQTQARTSFSLWALRRSSATFSQATAKADEQVFSPSLDPLFGASMVPKMLQARYMLSNEMYMSLLFT